MFDKLKEYKAIIIATLVALIIGVGFGRYAMPEKVTVTIKEIEVERIVTVEKKIFVKEEVKKTSKKTNTKTKKVTKPDGTIIEEKIESEEDITFADTKQKEGSEKSNTDEKFSSKDKTKETKYDTKRLRVSALVGVNTTALSASSESSSEYNGRMIYGVHAQYSFMGPFSVGAFGLTSKEFGVSVGFGF